MEQQQQQKKVLFEWGRKIKLIFIFIWRKRKFCCSFYFCVWVRVRVRENKWAGKIYGVLTRNSNTAVLARAPLQLLLFHFVVDDDDEGQKKERKKKKKFCNGKWNWNFFFFACFYFLFPSFSVNSPLSYQLTQVIFVKLSIQLFNHVIPRSS